MALRRAINDEYVDCTPEEEAAILADWQRGDAAIVLANAEGVRQQSILDDVLRQQLKDQLDNATNVQISNYVDNNVNSLADAKLMFKRILLLIAAD